MLEILTSSARQLGRCWKTLLLAVFAQWSLSMGIGLLALFLDTPTLAFFYFIILVVVWGVWQHALLADSQREPWTGARLRAALTSLAPTAMCLLPGPMIFLLMRSAPFVAFWAGFAFLIALFWLLPVASLEGRYPISAARAVFTRRRGMSARARVALPLLSVAVWGAWTACLIWLITVLSAGAGMTAMIFWFSIYLYVSNLMPAVLGVLAFNAYRVMRRGSP